MIKSKLFMLTALSLILLATLAAAMIGCSSSTTTTAAATTTPAPKPITLIFTSHDPANGSWSSTYGPWMQEIEQKTNGMVKIEAHWNGELVDLFNAGNAARDGTVDIAHIYPTMTPNIFPMEDVENLTSFSTSIYAVSQMFTELAKEFPQMQDAYTKDNLKLLFYAATFPNYFCTTKNNPIRTFEDMKGKKFLSTGTWDSEVWKAFGMTPVSMMPNETYSALQTGVMDGGVLTLPSLFDFNWGEVTPNISAVHARPAIWACVMNLDKWKSLPASYQKVIEDASAKIPALQDAGQWTMDKDLKAKAIQQFNTNFITLSPTELAKFDAAIQPVRAKFVSQMNAAGYPGQNLMDKFLDLEQKYSGSAYAPK
jgi:TRAP-type C4-dicarboxylate transport system substrate-binding protein